MPNPSRISWTTIIIALAAGAVVFGICGALYFWEVGQIGGNLRERETSRVKLLAYFFGQDFQMAATDLRVLADGDGLHAFLASGQQADLNRAIHRAALLSRQQPDFDQIRYLDEQGREIIRINRNGAIVPPEELQNKANRSYFKSAQALAPGQIYVSAFDLNVENGRIEQPPKPMVRFATPVFDANGRCRGVYIINFLGTNLLTSLQQFAPKYQHGLRVLNAQGYWILAARPDQEWGFMFPDRSGMTMASTDPALWTQILKANSGQIDHAGGVFTWTRVVPAELVGDNADKVEAQDSFLIIASEISADEWSAAFATLRKTFAIVAVILLLPGFALLWSLQIQRRAEQTLLQTEERTRLMIEGVKDYAIIMLDSNGYVISWNSGAQHIKGYDATEIVGQHFSCFYPEEALRRGLPEKALKTAESVGRFEDTGWRMHKDGSQFWANIVITAVRGTSGELLGFVKITRDLTEHRRAEQIQEERDRFFELSRDLICVAGFDGYFKTVNPIWERTLGYSHEELLAKPFVDFVHPDDIAATQVEAERLADGRETINFENRYRCKDGTYRWLAWSACADLPKKLIYATARDITERKHMEALLEREQHLLNELMDNATEDVYFKDRESRFIRINRYHAKRFGLDDPVKAIGKTDADFFSEEHARQAREDELKIMRTGKMIAKEEKETWPDGHVTWALTVKLPLRDELGNVVGTFGLSRDITDRKLNEQEIKKLNEDLLHRASQLEMANKELEAFSYSVSHDLRAPVRHIDGFVKLLNKQAREKLDAASQRYLHIIGDSAQQMGALIDDLLVFSRMGRSDLRHSKVASNSLVHEAVDATQMETNGRKIVWKISELPEVEADPGMLRQVWINLIANAVKYTRPRNPAEIEVGCNTDNGEFVFFVKDNGVGFDMQYVHKLFGVFQRLHRSDEFEGTGIGLANVRRIIHRHGGRTWAESTPNAGATFFFSLPKTKTS